MSDMLQFIKEFPSQINKGIEISKHISNKENKKISNVVIAGMGGSALPGDVLRDFLAEHIRIDILRSYTIPKHLLTENTLVFSSSFSGNTEETISALQSALNSPAHIIVVAHGGRLAEIAKENNLELITLPDAVQPRSATGFFLSSMITAMSNMGIIPSFEKELQSVGQFLEQEKTLIEENAQNLAKALKGFVPICYSGNSLESVTRIMKINFNETSKIQSFYNVLPEMNHNEMVGYTNLIMKPYMLFIHSNADHERVELRMKVFKEILDSKNVPHTDIQAPGQTHLGELFGVIFLAYFSSYYLAIEYGVDPAPVDMVEDFKRMLVS